MVLGVMVLRQLMLRWENDPVWKHDVSDGREVWSGCGYRPPPGQKTGRGQRRAERIKKSSLSNN